MFNVPRIEFKLSVFSENFTTAHFTIKSLANISILYDS
jgi:hypothetical protein